jgi:hypothetical protein
VIKRVLIALILGSAGMLYQSCGMPFKALGEAEQSSLKSDSTCDEVMSREFGRGYHQLVRRFNCQNCHAPGGLKADAPFAQSSLSAAFSDFKNRGPLRINSRFAENHNASVLNYTYTPQLETELRGLQADWSNAENSCATAGTSVLTTGKSADIFVASLIGDINHCGVGDPLITTHDKFTGITFDLGTARADLTGVSIKIMIKAESPTTIGANICAHQGYRAGNVTVTSSKKLRLKNLRIQLNGNNFGVNTFQIEREILAGASNVQLIESLNGGYGVFSSGSAKASDQWSLFIENLEVIN